MRLRQQKQVEETMKITQDYIFNSVMKKILKWSIISYLKMCLFQYRKI